MLKLVRFWPDSCACQLLKTYDTETQTWALHRIEAACEAHVGLTPEQIDAQILKENRVMNGARGAVLEQSETLGETVMTAEGPLRRWRPDCGVQVAWVGTGLVRTLTLTAVGAALSSTERTQIRTAVRDALATLGESMAVTFA